SQPLIGAPARSAASCFSSLMRIARSIRSRSSGSVTAMVPPSGYGKTIGPIVAYVAPRSRGCARFTREFSAPAGRAKKRLTSGAARRLIPKALGFKYSAWSKEHPVTELPTPTGRELEILKVLWDHGPSSVRTVYRHLARAQEEDLAYNTVQTLLRIMEKKGL